MDNSEIFRLIRALYLAAGLVPFSLFMMAMQWKPEMFLKML